MLYTKVLIGLRQIYTHTQESWRGSGIRVEDYHWFRFNSLPLNKLVPKMVATASAKTYCIIPQHVTS